MTGPQIEGLVRSLMLLASGFVLKYGIDAATWAAVTAGVVGVVGALWSWKSNSMTSIVTKAAKSPEVKQVVMESSKDSDAIPSSKVISHEP